MHVKSIAPYVESRTTKTTSSANQSFTFPTVFLYCSKMWEAALRPHEQCSLLVFTEAWSGIYAETASLKEVLVDDIGSLALLQIDLWAVKDGQINIFCILDRIRISGTCSHLHIALTYHISIVFVAHFNRLGGSGGFLPLYPMLFQSVLAVAQLCWFNRHSRNHTSCSDFFQLQP